MSALHFPNFQPLLFSAIGEKIFKNETGGKEEYLVFWNPKEKGVSLGIGHLTWRPIDCPVNLFPNVFKKFLKFCTEKGVDLPPWLQQNQKCPWHNRGEFLNESPEHISSIRNFLSSRKDLQTQFIIANFLKSLPQVIETMPAMLQEEAILYCNLLLSTPEGCFALLDYNHFKGQGLQLNSLYNNTAWGLKQVLETALAKRWQTEPLAIFIQSAKDVLDNRIKNAPADKQAVEQSYQAGWHNRINRYQESLV